MWINIIPKEKSNMPSTITIFNIYKINIVFPIYMN